MLFAVNYNWDKNVLNKREKEAYLSEDINFLEMGKYYNENEIKENEETLILR